MSTGADFCYNVCRDLLSGRALSREAVSYTRSAAAVLYSYLVLDGVTDIGRHLQLGVTYTYSNIEERIIACRVSLTEVLLDLLDLVITYLSTRTPSSADVPSE